MQIQVAHGSVTLSGTVAWNYQRRAAGTTVESIAGVRRVINNIELQSRVSSADTRDHIRSAFARLANLDANHIQVDVDGATVKPSGTVTSHAEKAAANHAAWSSPHVFCVIDQLRVAER